MAVPHRDLNQGLYRHGQPRLDIGSLAKPPAWMVDALCPTVDPELLFPEKGGNVAAAKKMCATCPVSRLCLEYALDYEAGAHGTLTSYPAGVYGGTTARERVPLLRERRAKEAS